MAGEPPVGERVGGVLGAWISLRVRVWVKAREPYCRREDGRSIRSWWAIISATRLQQHRIHVPSVVCVGGQTANHFYLKTFLETLRESDGFLESRPVGAFRHPEMSHHWPAQFIEELLVASRRFLEGAERWRRLMPCAWQFGFRNLKTRLLDARPRLFGGQLRNPESGHADASHNSSRDSREQKQANVVEEHDAAIINPRLRRPSQQELKPSLPDRPMTPRFPSPWRD